MRLTIPQHVAIIMDGNGRWAQSRGLPRLAGHKQGIEAVRRSIKTAHQSGVRYLTLYAFSAENWQRPPGEVKELMDLLRFYLRGEIATLHKEGIRLRVIGDRQRLAYDVVQLIDHAEKLTAGNGHLDLIIALSYGSRQEIVRAMQRLAKPLAEGALQPADLDESMISAVLDTAGVPDPDLMIRTSGEQRLSNFLLWQAAYAELYFTDLHWPDFGEAEFKAALQVYASRERRYGALNAPVNRQAG